MIIDTMNDGTRSIFDEAVLLKDQQRLPEARALLLEIHLLEPTSPAVLAILADVYWDEGDLENAVKYFRKATELVPYSETVSLGLFHCLWEQEHYDEAFEEIKRFTRSSDSPNYREIVEEILGSNEDQSNDT